MDLEDVAEEEENESGNGKRRFFSYDVDPLRERILQNGILAGLRNNIYDENNEENEWDSTTNAKHLLCCCGRNKTVRVGTNIIARMRTKVL